MGRTGDRKWLCGLGRRRVDQSPTAATPPCRETPTLASARRCATATHHAASIPFASAIHSPSLAIALDFRECDGDADRCRASRRGTASATVAVFVVDCRDAVRAEFAYDSGWKGGHSWGGDGRQFRGRGRGLHLPSFRAVVYPRVRQQPKPSYPPGRSRSPPPKAPRRACPPTT